MWILEQIAHALQASGDMAWQVLWPLALGFLLSAIVEAIVRKETITRTLGEDSARGVAYATALGAASSSCSYAAVAVARSLFRRGASFSNAIIFEFASTNLVFELGIVLLVLLGWQFLGAELIGGVVMVVLLACIFRLTLNQTLVDDARRQAALRLPGRMEGHAAMDMSVTEGRFFHRLFSARGFTSIAHIYFMNIASLWFDLVLGLLIAGMLAAWVPDSFWQVLFLSGHGTASEVWGAFVGPLIAVASFVCSVGNIPLAAVLWRGGISFAGVISFIFADLIIIPILRIYRKYYGSAMRWYLLAASYVTMVGAGLIVGFAFQIFHIVPMNRLTTAFQTAPSWNYDAFLNVVFLLLTVVLGYRFLRSGGVDMLRVMGQPLDHQHDHARGSQ